VPSSSHFATPEPEYDLAMRAALIVLGVLLILIGLVWIGQGLGFVKGSFMTGAMLWAWIGAGTALVGAAVISVARRLQLRR
jgi:hypothetical protein